MPLAESSLLSKPLEWITRLAVRAPRATLSVAIGLALVAITVTLMNLEFHTSRLDLLNPESSYNKLWINYIEEFTDKDDIVVVVESRAVDGNQRDRVIAAIEAVASELEQRDHDYANVFYKIDLSRIRKKQLHYLTERELEQLNQFLDASASQLRGQWNESTLSQVVARLTAALDAPSTQMRRSAAQQIDLLARNLESALAGRKQYVSAWSQLPLSSDSSQQLGKRYNLIGDGRMGLVLLQLRSTENSFTEGTDSIDDLRGILKAVNEGHPEVQIGLTGLPVMENDEMRASQSASVQASLLSLTGVACLFIAGFGGLRHPLMTVGALILALAWTFGYITVTIGHLNILSMSFGVILIGLGIDFGVHYVARYLTLRQTERASDQALIRTASGVGPGIVTGGATTAIAFFSAGLTDFTGIAELGIIAGGGILLCIAAAVVVLPAMIHLSDRNQQQTPVPRPISIDRILRVSPRFPRSTLLATVLATALLTLGLGSLWYDHNLLNLQPIGQQSVALEQRLLHETDQSVWFALSIAETPQELLKKQRAFEKLNSVERTEEIISMLPQSRPNVGDNRAAIAQIRQRLTQLPDRPPLLPLEESKTIATLVSRMQQKLSSSGGNRETIGRLRHVVEQLQSQSRRSVFAKVSQLQLTMAEDHLARLRSVYEMSDPVPPDFADLPQALVARFIGKSGTHLLKVYSKADIWDMEALEDFVADVRSIDPQATGKPLQTYEASLQMQQSYLEAAMYALIAVTIILILDFGNLRYSLLALIPVSVGMVQMFGLLGLLGIPLNPANMIVLPLILGIGLDDGVHVIHDFRCSTGRFRLSRSTATAVLITSLTTMVGFGSMMIASHRGLQSLGRVLTIGVTCCLFTSLVLLPAVLSWLSRNRPQKDDSQPLENSDSKVSPSPNSSEENEFGNIEITIGA